MGIEMFITKGLLVFIPAMYAFSMLWYYIVSKRRGVYLIESIVAFVSLIGISILILIGYSAEMSNALASIFGAIFLAKCIKKPLIFKDI